MARLNRGPNGPPSGKFGSVIGSSWRGIYYIKGLQKKINKARSPLQIAQQNKFAFVVKFLGPIKNLLDMGFSLINPGGATGYNMAISYTIQNCVKGTDPDFVLDYPNVVLCTKGKLTAPEITSVELDELTLKVTWNTDSNIYSSSADSVKTLIYHPKTGEYSSISANFIRGDGELTFKFRDRHVGNVVHIYMYFVSFGFETTKWSNSVYAGTLEIK
ncbi:MAG: DUF6266 family protein [Bacteroidota bacterium]